MLSRTRPMIMGTGGMLEADLIEQKIWVQKRHSPQKQEYFQPHQVLNQMIDFVDSIKEGKKVFAGGIAGRDSVAIGIAAELSIREHRMVSIEETASL